MKIIDRYILRLFLINFAILSVVVMLLIIVIDMLFALDEFVKAGEAAAKRQGGSELGWTLWVLFDYYWPLALFLYVYISGLIVVAAMGFTTVLMARSRELVTLIASGVSLHRVAKPLVIAGCVINGLTLLDQELLIPPLAPKLARDRAMLQADAGDVYAVFYTPDSQGNLISAGRFDADRQTLHRVMIIQRDDRGRQVRQITADSAQWSEDHKGWLLTEGRSFTRNADEGARGFVIEDAGEPAALFATDLTPRVLLARRAAIYPALLNMADLAELMDNPAASQHQVLRIMHGRFSLVIFNVLLLVMALPVFLTREPTNPLVQAVRASGLTLTAWGFGIGLISIAPERINPVVLAWLPVVIFLPLSTWMVQRIRS